MHSLKSLEEIRALEYLVGSRIEQEISYNHYLNSRKYKIPTIVGNIIGKMKYDLRTREITVERLL